MSELDINQILARNAKYQDQHRTKKRDAGLHEVRGCWLPKRLHKRVKAYAARLAKADGRVSAP